VGAIQRPSLARSIADIQEIVRTAARNLTLSASAGTSSAVASNARWRHVPLLTWDPDRGSVSFVSGF